jgi:hypothetical protein
MNLVVAGVVGALTVVAMIWASLRLYISIENPYLLLAASFVILEVITPLMRDGRSRPASLSANFLAFSLEALTFAASAALAFHGVMSIYPPNM